MAKTNNIDEILYPNKVYCPNCGKDKILRFFYGSKQEIHNNETYHQKYPICKQCIKNKVYNEKTGQLDKAEFKKMLQKLDLPFKNDVYLTALEDKRESFGTYISLLNTAYRQRQDMMCWADGETEEKKEIKNNQVAPQIINTQIDEKELNILIDKYGSGYTKEEYEAFEKKWNKLIDNYGEKTSFHIENLTTYIRFRVKEEMATAKGDGKSAKEWAGLAKDAATAAKINVSQLSKSDISGGVELVPQLFEAVESKVGIIPILPKLKEQPYDDADIIIWCEINYLRRLEDKPRVEYKDIWGFYDEMLEEHYKQKGYSKEDIDKEKAKRNNVFRDLGEIYKEPIYEESDT